jgi:multicomponent Na+:H+ antiporter subunit C
MIMQFFPFVVVAWILATGLYGVVTSRHLVHQIICLIIVQSSTYVLLLSVGYRIGAVAPYFSDIPLHTPAVDPVVQALALTDVVVEAAVSALLLALAVQAHKRFGTLDPQRLVQLRG